MDLKKLLDDVTVTIASRNNPEFLEQAVKSVRDNYPNIRIFFSASNVNDETKKRFDKIAKDYKCEYNTFKDDVDIVSNYEYLFSNSTKITFLMHDDMVIGKYALENALKHLKKRTIVSSTRIEPPLFREEPKVKITKDFGKKIEEFDYESFIKHTEKLVKDNNNKSSDGVFAPHMFYTEDWIGMDYVFSPFIHEDADWQYRMKKDGYSFVQPWDSIVYHFTSRSMKFKNGIDNVNPEYNEANSKNIINFVRKHKITPTFTTTKNPVIPPNIHMSTVIIVREDMDLDKYLPVVEPYFDDVVVMVPREKTEKMMDKVSDVLDTIDNQKPNNFDRNKVRIYRFENVESGLNVGLSKVRHKYVFVPNLYDVDYSLMDSLRYILQKESDKDFIKIPIYIDGQSSHFIVDRKVRFNGGKANTQNGTSLKPMRQSYNINTIRKLKTLPSYYYNMFTGQDRKPYLENDDNYKTIGLAILHRNEEYLLKKVLTLHEPFFDEIVIVNDGDSHKHIDEVLKTLKKKGVDVSKIKVRDRRMNNDFASQRNYASEQLNTDYVFHLDCDEEMDYSMLSLLRPIVSSPTSGETEVIAFPRKNYVDGQMTSSYPDYQGRLHKKGFKWVNTYPFKGASPGCHEQLEPMAYGKNIRVGGSMHLIHTKTSKKQTRNDNNYKKLWRMPIKPNKFLYDTVLFTDEGITKHAREEQKEMLRRGFKVSNLYPPLENSKYYEELKDAFQNFPLDSGDYVTIINQPPTRWDRSIRYNNIVGYVAMEGHIPDDWVKRMNHDKVNQIWTPSSFSKRMFEESGVTTPIKVIPHGVDRNVWKPMDVKKATKFTFLACGAPNGPRKGLDIAIRQFCKQFTPEDDVQLLLKINKIYDNSFDVDRFITRHATEDMREKILYTTDELSEENYAKLFNMCHVYVSPHRCEGFGLHILEAMSCGIPVIATNASGNTDFCNDKNCTLTPVEDKPYIPPLRYPYQNAKWFRPNEAKFGEQMRYVFDNYDKIKEKQTEHEIKTAKKYSWSHVVNKMLEALK